MTGDNRYFTIRTILEVPICDEHKWSKVPSLPADAVILDMEDSAPPALKSLARSRAVEYLARPAYFGQRPAIPRTNGLDTEWGYEDIVALARAHAPAVAYPKTRSAADLRTINHVFAREGAPLPDLFPVIESAEGVLCLEGIASAAGVRGLWLGPADLAIDAGFDQFVEGEVNDDAYCYPKSKLILTAAAHGLPAFDTAILTNFRDLEQVRRRARRSRHLGFTGMISFYPPQLPVINEVFGRDEREIAYAREVVVAYEGALREGRAAVQLRGEALIVQDYKRARALLARFGEINEGSGRTEK